jgi:hypothetical protein
MRGTQGGSCLRSRAFATGFSNWRHRNNLSDLIRCFSRTCRDVRAARLAFLAMFLAVSASCLFAKVTGSISGTVRDPQEANIPGASVELRNVQTGIVQTGLSDSAGFYSFPALDVGVYDITFKMAGFQQFTQTNLRINVDTSLKIDAKLKVGSDEERVTVTSDEVAVDTETSQIGEVIGEKEMTDLPLNGRSFTDLLALQPGVVPISTSQYGSLLPANSLNNGLLSMGGSRDANSGFMVNGANVVEGFGAGTTVVPNIDSIGEFRIITSNAGAEYGNYAGALVNVVTKSGTNQIHGNVFEFLRNSDLDSRNYFSPTRGVFRQNQFGGTFGGPVLRNKAFFFVDYQGTRQTIGVDTGLILVPTSAEKSGDFSATDDASTLSDTSVKGAYWASVLSNRLGYTVTQGEPYYAAGCTNTTDCVFPGAQVPKKVWDPVSPNLLPLIPAANSGNYFSTSKYPQTLQDDKGALRIDLDTRIGRVTGYYHDDPWTSISPYGVSSGSNLPGFPGEAVGGAQLATFGITTTLGPSAVNQFTASYFRNLNTAGKTSGAAPALDTLGFASASDGGIYQLTPAYPKYPTVLLNNYTLGPPEAISTQANNTYQFQDDFTKTLGNHTLKFGADYHWDHIDISRPDMKFYFKFNGRETGIDLLDMLLGAPNSYFQATPASAHFRNFYAGAYGEDSWHMTKNVTVSYGVRWEVDPYWATSNDNQPVLIAGKQSVKFPTAPAGYLFPGDPGVPKHMANIRWNDFAPRIGISYSPDFANGILHTIFGNAGKSSIRAGYGLYYTNIEASSVYSFSAPPYGYHYSSPAPPLLSKPFITRSSGYDNGQRFPLTPVSDSASIDWSRFLPISSIRSPLVDSPSPYSEHVDLSFQRQLAANTMMTLSYVGSFGHHLIVNADNNPGDPALCLSLSDPSQVVAGTDTCGPDGESTDYYPVGGGVVQGTRGPFGHNFLGNGVQLDIGNSSYHALEATLRQVSTRASLLLSYTFSKALDNGSGFGEQVILKPNGEVSAPRSLSLYDMTHNFSASYTVEVPIDKLLKKNNQLTRGWKISGVTEFTTGLPVTLYEMDDQSLLGSTNNSGYYGSPDSPTYTPGNIYADKNPRHGKAYFNTSLFSPEPLGQIGNSPRRFFHGPGIDNWNLSMLKDAKLKEGLSMEFRAEFFNVFNHAQFQGAFSTDGTIDDGEGAFGYVTTAADPRIGQMALKLRF